MKTGDASDGNTEDHRSGLIPEDAPQDAPQDAPEDAPQDAPEDAPEDERSIDILITFAGGSPLLDNEDLFSKVSDFLAELSDASGIIAGSKVDVRILTGSILR